MRCDKHKYLIENFEQIFLCICFINSLLDGLSNIISTYFRLLSLAFCFIFILLKLFTRDVGNKKDIPILFTLLFLNLFTLCFFSISTSLSNIISLTTKSIMVVCLLILNKNHDYSKQFLLFFLLSSFLASAGLIKDFVGFGFIKNANRFSRFSGLYGNPNFSGIASFFSIMTGCYVFKKTLLNNKITLLFILINCVCLYYSDCRSAQLSLISCALLFLLRNYKKYLFAGLGCLLVFIIIYLVYNSRTLFSNSIYTKDFTDFEMKLHLISSYRYTIWKEACFISKGSLLFGYGIKNIVTVFNSVSTQYNNLVFTRMNLSSTHNFIFDSLLESGIIETFIYICFLFSKFKLFYKELNNRKYTFNILLCISCLIISMLDTHIGTFMTLTSVFFWSNLNFITIND